MGGEVTGDWRMIALVLMTLFFFGLSYNSLVNYLGERKDGYTALLVVAGVLITLGGIALIDWRAAALALAAFAASGTPMVLGDIYCTITKRERAIRMMQLIAAAKASDITDGGDDGEA